MGSQIPVYYTRGYPFSYPPRAHDGFYPQVPMGMGIFATPNCIPLVLIYLCKFIGLFKMCYAKVVLTKICQMGRLLGLYIVIGCILLKQVF